jgi:glycosyltransferase involved in cell wall biosynthesis
LTGSIAPLSVVIPAYNAESFIEEAIRSVYAQTFKVAELIVVADSCSDRTPQIATEMGATVLEQNRRNIAAALNLGVSAATQPWIALLDADDVWDQEKIAFQWKGIQTCSDVGLIACDCYSLVDGEIFHFERNLDQRWDELPDRIATEHCQYLAKVDGEFFKRFYLQTSQVVLRRDAISKVGLLDERLVYWQTIEFFTRVLRHYPLAFVERPLVYQRLHSANHTRNAEGYWSAYVSMTDRMLKNPELYPEGAGEAYRECLKRDFHQTERELAQLRIRTPNSAKQTQPSNPNHP